jgi:hypothetical protein
MRSLAIILCLVWIATGAVLAEDSSPPAIPLSVSLERLPLRCQEPIYRIYVTAETGKFTFVLPAGYRLRGDPVQGKLKVGNLEGNCQISFSILNSTPCEGQDLSVESYRRLLQARHPSGRILSEFTRQAEKGSGPGFDIQWETTNKFPQRTYIVFLPSTAGVLEFSATSSPKDITNLQYLLVQVMASFQGTTPGGKLEVPHISAADSDRSDARDWGHKRHFQETIGSG